MEEVRRFLRYTLPGMATMMLLLSMVAVSDYARVKAVFMRLGSESTVAAAVGVFLCSGAVGFVLANLYFAVYWSDPFCRWFAIDHRPALNELKDMFEIRRVGGSAVSTAELTKREAWAVVCQLWWSQSETSPTLRGANGFCDRLVDMTHGIGATLIGSILAVIGWGCFHFGFNRGATSGHFLGVLAPLTLWGVIVAVYGANFLRTVRAHETIVNSTLYDNMVGAAGAGRKPTILLPP